MSVSLPPHKLADIQQLAHFLVVDLISYSPSGHVLFRQGQFLCQWPIATGGNGVMSFRVTC